MSNFEYGGKYKLHNMDGIIKVKDGTLKVHDIFDPLPEFMKEADCIFVDPPCSQANLSCFYTKSGMMNEHFYDEFEDRLFECIDEIKPKRLFVEVFKSNYNSILTKVRERYEYVTMYQSHYYNNKSNECWIIYGSDKHEHYLFNGMDESLIIQNICFEVPFKCIGDLCMGQGLVGKRAHDYGKKFVGTELNYKRLAVLVDYVGGRIDG